PVLFLQTRIASLAGHAAVAAAIGGAAEAPVRVSGSGCSDTVIAISHTRRSRPSGPPPPEDSGGAAIPTAECVEFTLWLPSSCSAACGGGSAVIRGHGAECHDRHRAECHDLRPGPSQTAARRGLPARRDTSSVRDPTS